MNTRVEIDAGACGYTTRVDASFTPETGTCTLKIETPCPAFRPVAERLIEVRPAEESCWDKSLVHGIMREHCKHTACPVPAGVVKAVQVASGMKPPVDAAIRFVQA